MIIIYEIIWSFYAPHPFDDNCLQSITTKYLNLDILSNILFVSVFLLMKCILTFNFYVIRFKSIWHRALSIVYLTFASVDFLFDSANKRWAKSFILFAFMCVFSCFLNRLNTVCAIGIFQWPFNITILIGIIGNLYLYKNQFNFFVIFFSFLKKNRIGHYTW